MNLDKLKDKLLSNYEEVEGPLDTPCWEWQGSRVTGGYGNMTFEMQSLYTHRASWLVHKGSIPDDIRVCHHCDNRPCINPDHLWLGTQEDNLHDMQDKGRKNQYSILDEDDVRQIRSILNTCGYSQREIGELFGVSRSTILQIKLGNNWAHVE